jgi:hypothetical protein
VGWPTSENGFEKWHEIIVTLRTHPFLILQDQFNYGEASRKNYKEFLDTRWIAIAAHLGIFL